MFTDSSRSKGEHTRLGGMQTTKFIRHETCVLIPCQIVLGTALRALIGR